MRTTELSDEQWRRIEPFLPPLRQGKGRPRANDRLVLNGILFILRTGCRWEDIPREYASPATAWRRLRQWEQDGTWERIWRTLLAGLDAQGKLKWAQAFLDGSFVPAKKGEPKSGSPNEAKEPR